MKIDFDKFNLSQKIYSVIGVVSAIFVYMVDKYNLNMAIGLILLTAIAVLLLKYRIIRIVLNSLACLFVVASIATLIYVYISEQQQYKGELTVGQDSDATRQTELKQLYRERESRTEADLEQLYTKVMNKNTNSYFTIGSTKEEVRRIQGSPTSIIGKMWFYGRDSVSFDYNERVEGYMNNSGKLKVE